MVKLFNYAGPINFVEIYNLIKSWCTDNGFDVDQDKIEYSEKEGKIDEFKAQRKVNGYVSYLLKITLEFRNLKKKAVVINGKNENVLFGAMTGDINMSTETNYEKLFPDDKLIKKTILPIYKNLFDWLESNKYSDECDEYLDSIYNTIKAKLELYSTLDGY